VQIKHRCRSVSVSGEASKKIADAVLMLFKIHHPAGDLQAELVKLFATAFAPLVQGMIIWRNYMRKRQWSA
jgi:hypothetical protein